MADLPFLVAVCTVCALAIFPTAGAVNSTKIPDLLRNQTLRIIYMDEENSHIYWNNKTKVWGGVLPQVYEMIAEMAGFTMIDVGAGLDNSQMAISQGSRNEHESTFTACVADVGKGILDVCVGNFWETPLRRGLASFVTPFAVENFFCMVVSRPASPDLLSNAFLPFDLYLWLLLCAAMVFQGFLQWLLEYKEKKKKKKTRPLRKRVIKMFSSMFEHVHSGFLGFVSGGPAYESRSVSSRLLILGYGFLIVVIISSYTANLAAFLTKKEKSVPFSTMEEGVKKGVLFCCDAVALSTLESLYPSGRFKPSYDTEANFQAVLSGDCGALITSYAGLESRQGGGQYCNLVTVDTPVSQMMDVQPVAEWINPTLSFYLSGLRADGTIARLFEEEKAKMQGCEKSQDEETDKLTIKNLASAFIIFMIIAGMAVFVWVIETYCRHKRIKEKAAAGLSKSNTSVDASITSMSEREQKMNVERIVATANDRVEQQFEALVRKLEHLETSLLEQKRQTEHHYQESMSLLNSPGHVVPQMNWSPATFGEVDPKDIVAVLGNESQREKKIDQIIDMLSGLEQTRPAVTPRPSTPYQIVVPATPVLMERTI
mmetsp:Transcript_27098/g.62460  ORF Transcript_27098/g.62460 Transcript_27098/m.62460 type:complete len:599 (+) Transcript_27098:101-1897(+)